MLPLPSSPNSLVFCASVPARVRASDPAVGGAAGGLAGARERGAGAEGLAHAAGGQAEEETPDRGRGLGAERPQGLPGKPPSLLPRRHCSVHLGRRTSGTSDPVVLLC